MDEGFAEVWVSSGDVPSLELCRRAPVPPTDGWCSLRQRTPTLYPITHLNFGPGPAPPSPLGAQISALLELIEGRWRAFLDYRRLTPFYLKIGWHFDEELDLTISPRVAETLARLRAPIDLDLYWNADDDFTEEFHHELPFFYGEANLSIAERQVRDGIDAAHDLGRLVPQAVRMAAPGDGIEIDVRGGCGRPTAHFSAYALRKAATHDSPIRLRVRPNVASRAPRRALS